MAYCPPNQSVLANRRKAIQERIAREQAAAERARRAANAAALAKVAGTVQK